MSSLSFQLFSLEDTCCKNQFEQKRTRENRLKASKKEKKLDNC